MTLNKSRWLGHLSFEKGSWADCCPHRDTPLSIKVLAWSSGFTDRVPERKAGKWETVVYSVCNEKWSSNNWEVGGGDMGPSIIMSTSATELPSKALAWYVEQLVVQSRPGDTLARSQNLPAPKQPINSLCHLTISQPLWAHPPNNCPFSDTTCLCANLCTDARQPGRWKRKRQRHEIRLIQNCICSDSQAELLGKDS